MRLTMERRHRLKRIEARIGALGERAAELLECEQRSRQRLEELRAKRDDGGRLRRARHGRALQRYQQQLERHEEERRRLVEAEMRSIMLLLQEQSSKTRERLDRELQRLTPLEEEWERIRAMFGALEETVSTPALEELAGAWRGELEIPAFPVHEQKGYIKPFPRQAILF